MEATGKFACPNCNNMVVYEVRNQRLWATLFFVPVFPLEGKNNFFVQCENCDSTYRTEVLDNNNYYLDGRPFLGGISDSGAPGVDPEGGKRIIRECPICKTLLRLPRGKTGIVKCSKCGASFSTTT